jgi:predicted ATPase
MLLWLAVGTVVEGWALVMEECNPAGIDQMHKGIADFRAIGAGVQCPFFLAALAEAHAKLKDFSAMAGPLEEALELVETTGEQWWAADLHRLKGEMLLHLSADNSSAAESQFKQAIHVALHQRAKSLELRATMSLARLWAEHGERARAGELLTPVYSWFREGFDAPDLKEARSLVEALQ